MVGHRKLELGSPFVDPLEPLPDGPHPAQKNTTLHTTDSSMKNRTLITRYRRVAILRFIGNFDITVINLVCV